MLDLVLAGAVGFCVGVVFMWFWYPTNLARHPEKLAAIQARAEKLMAGANEIFARTLQSIKDAQQK